MGRAYNSLVQETRIADDKNYAILKAELKRELIASMDRYLHLLSVYRLHCLLLKMWYGESAKSRLLLHLFAHQTVRIY